MAISTQSIRLRPRLSCRSLPPFCLVRRAFFSPKPTPRVSHELDVNRINARRREYDQNRTAFLAAGAAAGIISFLYTAWKLNKAFDAKRQKEKLSAKCDAPISAETFKTEAGEKRKVVLHDDQGNEIVPTEHPVVPAFPRLIDITLPDAQPSRDGHGLTATSSDAHDQRVEFTLVGLGLRSVTFIGIQVYLLGFYVATNDIARLQHFLVKKINPLATTLIPSEKEALRKLLRDATEGEETWDAILREAGCRSAIRIAPVRDTDFHHLRDGFVRAIMARSQQDKACADEAFGQAMKDFKTLFRHGSVPKKKELLLCRNSDGTLRVMYGGADNAKQPSREVLGVVADERLSRLLWLNYLAGKKVASEGARQNIIEGIMEFVERPVGTVEAQVV